MPKIGKRGQQRAVKALMNRLANFEKLHGATYNLLLRNKPQDAPAAPDT